MNKVRVLIPHSWSYNCGDAAILESILHAIEGITSEGEITVLTSHPSFTKKLLPDANASFKEWIWPIPEIEKEPGILDHIRYTGILMANITSVFAFRYFKKNVFIFNKKFEQPMKSFFDCDIVLSPGGYFLGPDYFFLTSIFELTFAKMLGKKTVIFAQSIGEFNDVFHRIIVSNVLKGVDLILIRDSASVGHLRSMGITNFELTSDIVFGANYGKFGGRKNEIIISGKLPNKRLSNHKEQFMKTMGTLATRIIEEFNCQITLLPTDQYDIPFQKEMLSYMPQGVNQITEIYSPKKMVKRLSSSEFLISCRMHAIILGCHSSTPFFAIGDSQKFVGVLEEICQGSHVNFSEFNNSSIEKILSVIRDRDRHKVIISQNFPKAAEKAKTNAVILENKLKEWGLI